MRLTTLTIITFALPVAANAQIMTNPQQVANVSMPLANHPQGQAMMATAVRNAALLDVNLSFIDKTYENDTYATDPFGNKYRTGCYRFKAMSGFRFKADMPTYSLTSTGLTVTQNISRIEANTLAAKVQVVACADIGIGWGVKVSDLKLVYKARPMISVSTSGGSCSVSWNQDTDDLQIAIGDINIIGVQNDVDKLAKNAVREAVNAALDGFFGTVLRNELLKVSTGVCGGMKKQ